MEKNLLLKYKKFLPLGNYWQNRNYLQPPEALSGYASFLNDLTSHNLKNIELFRERFSKHPLNLPKKKSKQEFVPLLNRKGSKPWLKVGALAFSLFAFSPICVKAYFDEASFPYSSSSFKKAISLSPSKAESIAKLAHSAYYPEIAFSSNNLEAFPKVDETALATYRSLANKGYQFHRLWVESGNQHLGLVNKQDFGYIAIKDKEAIISIRGTSSMEDILTDLTEFDFTSPQEMGLDGLVHRGFYEVAQDCYDSVTNVLDSLPLDKKNLNLLITGHSLGGAVAELLGGSLVSKYGVNKGNIELVTYGKPKVGNRNFTASQASKVPRSFHYAQMSDPVVLAEPAHLASSTPLVMPDNYEYSKNTLWLTPAQQWNTHSLESYLECLKESNSSTSGQNFSKVSRLTWGVLVSVGTRAVLRNIPYFVSVALNPSTYEKLTKNPSEFLYKAAVKGKDIFLQELTNYFSTSKNSTSV